MNEKGQTVTGKVKSVDAKGAEIELGEDVTGYLRASEISRDRVDDATTVLKVGDEVTAVVTTSTARIAASSCPSRPRTRRPSRKPWPA